MSEAVWSAVCAAIPDVERWNTNLPELKRLAEQYGPECKAYFAGGMNGVSTDACDDIARAEASLLSRRSASDIPDQNALFNSKGLSHLVS